MRPLRCNLSNFRNATTHAPFANVPYRVFDRYTKRLQKERAILRGNHENCRRVDYIQNEVVERMLERVQVVQVTIFLFWGSSSLRISSASLGVCLSSEPVLSTFQDFYSQA